MGLAFDLEATWVLEACLGLLDFWLQTVALWKALLSVMPGAPVQYTQEKRCTARFPSHNKNQGKGSSDTVVCLRLQFSEDGVGTKQHSYHLGNS